MIVGNKWSHLLNLEAFLEDFFFKSQTFGGILIHTFSEVHRDYFIFLIRVYVKDLAYLLYHTFCTGFVALLFCNQCSISRL